MSSTDIIYNLAVSHGCFAEREASMSEYTTMKTGGKAELLVVANDKQSLLEIVKACYENNINYLVLGNGSNMIVSDKGISGVVIKLGSAFSEISYKDDGTIICGAAANLIKVCNFALKEGLCGLEFAYGIPGSVGGAVYMNAGAYGGEMKNVIVSCEHITNEGKLEKINASELELGYRHSFYTNKNYVITEVEIKLEKGNPDEIKAKMTDFMDRRKDKQPLEYPSAGSVFKRPEGYFAGALIEGCGLKGKTIGGAQVSEKHAGFIINIGGATTSDILNLISFIQEKVFEKYNVRLETEVKIIGD